ncbi:hypothetical protein ACLK1S_05975 [Escherichia coli]
MRIFPPGEFLLLNPAQARQSLMASISLVRQVQEVENVGAGGRCRLVAGAW